MIAVCVDPKRINEVWPNFKHLIDRAIHKVGVSNFRGIEKEVIAGRALLWLACEETKVYAAAVTELHDGVCTIVACAGNNLPEFLPLISSLEQFARDEKCKSMRIIGRKGWLKVLKGYRPKAYILERPL